MRIAATGFVSEQAGSVASANALFLRDMLARGHQIDFFSKSSFVDPRPAVGEHSDFCFHDCTNGLADRFRRRVERIPLVGFAAGRWDCATYVELLKTRMEREQRKRHFELVLWLGDYAWRRVPGVPQVSFVQGPPGTDARAFVQRFDEVRRLGGLLTALRWLALARLRLSPLGLPRFQCSDHLIVGSRQSKRTLVERYRISAERVATLPYPIDLNLFRLEMNATGLRSPGSSLRILWLGRVVPRKRLDLFLDGAALAIRDGVDLRLTIVGGIGLMPQYGKLIAAFPFPERLEWIRSVPRAEVPTWLHRHDILCQPSEEEDFGSSVAEAQACGLPVIVGRTNGNADYLCGRDTHLADDRPETLASVFRDYAERKRIGGEAWGDPAGSRALAEREFAVERVTERLLETLHAVARTDSVSV